MKDDTLHADWLELTAQRDAYRDMPSGPAKCCACMALIGTGWQLLVDHWHEIGRLIRGRPKKQGRSQQANRTP